MDDNDLSWPRKEPDKWRGAQITRDQARNPLLDAVLDIPGLEALGTHIDEAQGDAQNGECFLLIRIVDR